MSKAKVEKSVGKLMQWLPDYDWKQRDQMMKDATIIANKIKDDAKAETSKISEKMISDATAAIQNEKKSAMAEIKILVSSLSLEIAEKILREKLKDDKAQKDLVEKYLKEAHIN